MNTKMIKGTPVRDHMMHVITLFNEMDWDPKSRNWWKNLGWYDLKDLTGFLQVV